MVARANVVAYDRLLVVVLCVLATCSSRGDTVVRKDISVRARARFERERSRGNAGDVGRGVCRRLVELEREANEMGRAVCVVQFAESGAHPYLVSTRYRCVIGYVKRRVFVSMQCTCTASI